MNFKQLSLILLMATFIQTADAQTFGVRAGLNYSTFLGPTKSAAPVGDRMGVEENYSFSSGFHFGLSYAYDFTDLFSLRTELVYIQNGTQYNYDGDSYYIIRQSTPTTFEKGFVDYDLTISNAYISIPIMANYRINRKWEIFGGPYINMSIGPTGRGKLRFESYGRPEDILFRQSLDFNYGSDAEREISGSSPSDIDEIGIRVDGNVLALPRFAGAYTRQGERTANRFNFLDYGLTVGAHYFLNRGFFIGLQFDFGIPDLTNDDVDVNLQELNPDNSFIFDDDNDRHFGIHTSFGFRF